MIKINLIGKRRKSKLPTVLGVDLNTLNFKLIILAYILGMIGETYMKDFIDEEKSVIQEQLSSLSSINKRLTKELGGYDKTRDELKRFNDQVDRLKERSKQVTAIINQKTNPKPVLEQVAKLLPEDVWLESLEIREGNKIRMSGGSESYVSVGNFIMSANETTYLENLSLESTDVQEEGEGADSRRIETFTIKGDVVIDNAWAQ